MKNNVRIFHEEIGTNLKGKNFNRKGNVYYRLFGEGLLQTVCVASDKKFSTVGGTNIFVNIEPLYGQMRLLYLPHLSMTDLCFFSFARIVGKDITFEEQMEAFKRSYVDLFDQIETSQDLLNIKKKWWSDFEMETDESEEPDEFDVYFEQLFPDIAGNTAFYFPDDGMLYAAIASKQYSSVVSHIKHTYYFSLAMLKYDLENGRYDREDYELERKETETDFKQELKICELIESQKVEEIENILQENYRSNLGALKKRLKLAVE